MRNVKFLGDITSTQYGSFRTGDIGKNLSDEFAAHVVDELKVAQYHGAAVETRAAKKAAAAEAVEVVPARGRRAAKATAVAVDSGRATGGRKASKR